MSRQPRSPQPRTPIGRSVFTAVAVATGALLFVSSSVGAGASTSLRLELGAGGISAGIVGISGSPAANAAPAVCGNGVIEPSVEQCDDGNTIDGDGCDGNCAVRCQKWEVDFALTSASGAVGALQLAVGYAGAPGDFASSGASVQCTSQVTGSEPNVAFNDNEAAHELGLGWVAVEGFEAPQLLATCTFFTSRAPTAGDFSVTVEAALDPDLEPVSVSIDVAVRDSADRSECPGLCGDGQLSVGEECDDANDVDTDGCTSGCRSAVCGDGSLYASVEQCDDGNLLDADGCDADCTFPCPQWEVEFSLLSATGEVGSVLLAVDYGSALGEFVGTGRTVQCANNVTGALFGGNDDEAGQNLSFGWASENGFSAPRVLATCTFEATGTPAADDFQVSVTEATDIDLNPIPVAIGVLVRDLSEQAQCPGFCGDGEVAYLEECDDGNAVNTDGCTTACTTPTCGDGYVQVGNGEVCDDGNGVNTDECTNECLSAACGDGFAHVGVEQCDDGNVSSSDGCTNSCLKARCGDGFTREGVEQCDDANTSDNDACLGTCKAAKCGDGYLRSDVEQCDDGNLSDLDACPSTCQLARCGDGFTRWGYEQCDDADSSNIDACSNACESARCGDGFVQAGVEQCDDENLSDADACPGNCQTAACGDGFLYEGVEQCDDGNTLGNDRCTADCKSGRMCGDATADGRIVASDALRTLRRAVGQDVVCPDWICDVDEDGQVVATDALLVLRTAVGLPVELHCGLPTALVLRLMTAGALGALQFEVDHASVAGQFSGTGLDVQCEGLVGDASFVFNDTAQGVLKVGVIALNGFSGPRSLARCEFTTTADVAPEDFTVTVTDASTPNSEPVTGVEVQVLPY